MKFLLAHLFLFFPVLILTVMFVSWRIDSNLSTAEKERRRRIKMTRVDILGIQSGILAATSDETEDAISEIVINQWLSGNLPSSHPAIKRLLHYPNIDPWGQPYRYIATDHALDPVKVFSTGRDKITNTAGNDLDDLSSWNIEGANRYYDEFKRKNTARSWIVGGISAPLIYLVLIAIFRRVRNRP